MSAINITVPLSYDSASIQDRGMKGSCFKKCCHLDLCLKLNKKSSVLIF